MSWAYRRRESQTPPSPGCLLLSHHQSGSQCVRCFIQHSCVYFWHLAASSDTKEGGGVCCGSPEWGHDCFMFPNLPDHRRLTSNNQNTCFQTVFLVQPLLRWKGQKVFDRGEIAPRSKTRRCLNGGTEWFSIDECFGVCLWCKFYSKVTDWLYDVGDTWPSRGIRTAFKAQFQMDNAKSHLPVIMILSMFAWVINC